jgi:methylmalonyl-CoA mutase C-terminal domain/subunit
MVKAQENSRNKRIKILVAKPGLDGHDRGAKVLVHVLRDAGMEVLYTGLHKTIQEIVEIALQEDVDVIGMSIYSGAHLPLSKKLIETLRAKDFDDVLVLIGGNIPQQDIETLVGYGVAGVFPAGSRFDDIVGFIRERVDA